METLLTILISVAGIYLLLCAFYFFLQERLIFVPWSELNPAAVFLLGSDYEEYYLEGEESGLIHALRIKTPHARGCVLYFHGNTGSMHRWAAIAEELTTYGFDVFLPDYRGYGQSKGKRSEALLHADALACYKKALQWYPEERICIYGRSLGSGMATWLAARVNAGALVLETPYNNLVDVARYHAKIIPVAWFLRYTFRNDAHIRSVSMPILVAHGTKDLIVPYRLGLKLYQLVKARPDTKMLTIPGGHHGDLNGFPVFRKTMERFFDKHFPQGAPKRRGKNLTQER